MNNKNIIYEELKRNEIDIDKQTLSFHIDAILQQNRDLYREMNAHSLDLEQVYREINITNFGQFFAYLAFVCLQNGSEECIRQNVQRCIDACRNISIPKAKQNNKQFMLITLSLTLIALYISL